MRNEHKVVVLKAVRPDNGAYWVLPPRLVASAGDIVTFKANGSMDGTTRIDLPNGMFDPLARQAFDLQPGQSRSLLVRADAAEGAYPYVVSCTPAMIRARGASDPEIIIDN